MAHFYIYETPTIPIVIKQKGKVVKDILKDYERIIVTITQYRTVLNKTDKQLGIDVENSLINMSLSQEESSMFEEGKAEVQINIYYKNTIRKTTAKGTIRVKDNLYKEVIT